MGIEMQAHEGDRFVGGDPVEHGDAGQRGAGAAPAAAARDLHPLGSGAFPRLAQGFPGVGPIARQPEIRPSDPARLPFVGGWGTAEEVEAELGTNAVR